MDVRAHTFRGKRWRLIEVDHSPRVGGDCEAPHIKGKVIRISRRVHGPQRLTYLLHEALHACLWDLDEEAVTETANDVARLLWRVGYREGEQGDRNGQHA